MIYDCFLYNGEEDLLEIRLSEMCLCEDFVTPIIVEANVTHTGKPKELYFEKQKERFKRFKNITYYVVDNMPVGESPREMEKHQRNAIMEMLRFLSPNQIDPIIISDVDEIPRAKSINLFMKSNLNFAALIQDKYGYYLNWLESEQSWDRIRIMKYKYLEDKTPEEVRNSGYDFSIHHAGWHFSWLHNGAEEKLKSFSHQELNTIENLERISNKENIWNDDKFKRVDVDLSFPEYLYKNQNKFKHIIDESGL